MAKRVAQMIDEQVHKWKLNHPECDNLQAEGNPLPVITISREYGAQGKEVAAMLQELIGFKVWDKEILNVISERLQSSSEVMEKLDEQRQNAIEDTIFGFLNNKNTNLNYLIYLVKAVEEINRLGNAIIIGRGANFILKKRKSFNVRLVAPFSNRVAHIAESDGIGKDEARVIVFKKEQARMEFTEHNFNHDSSNSLEYDLVINLQSLSLEAACELIITGYQAKMGINLEVRDLAI